MLNFQLLRQFILINNPKFNGVELINLMSVASGSFPLPTNARGRILRFREKLPPSLRGI